MRRFFQGITFILLWGLLLGGGYLAYEAHRFLSTPASVAPQEVIFTIKPGATFDRVAWDLKKAGVISDVFRFRLLAQYHDALGRVRAGDYLLSTGWTPDQVLRQITEGRAMLFRLSIREGLTWWETAKAIEEQGFARFEDFKEVIHDPAFLREQNIPFANAEGFLYPETYMLQKPRSPLDKQQAREVAEIMVGMFWKKTEPLWKQMSLREGAGGEPGQLGVPLLPPVPGAMSSLPAGSAAVPGGGTSEPSSRPLAPRTGNGANAGGPPASTGPEKHGAVAGYTATLASQAPPERIPSVVPQTAHASGLAGWGADPALSDGVPKASQQGVPATIAAAALPAPQGAAPAAPEPGGIYRGNATAVTAPPVSPENSSDANAGPAAMPAPGAQYRRDPGAPSVQGGAPPRPDADAAAPQADPDVEGPRSPAEVDPKEIRHLVILASLVEKETAVPEERGRVAGVYANRLRLNMLLQCDPTIIYGVGQSFTGAIRRSQIDDPKNLYNTYQHPGLPPGPICSSGLASLQAAFEPEKHDFLYFVANGLDSGHTFSKSLNEHNRAVQVYRARMRANKK